MARIPHTVSVDVEVDIDDVLSDLYLKHVLDWYKRDLGEEEFIEEVEEYMKGLKGEK